MEISGLRSSFEIFRRAFAFGSCEFLTPQAAVRRIRTPSPKSVHSSRRSDDGYNRIMNISCVSRCFCVGCVDG